jgi:hypothetical protein
MSAKVFLSLLVFGANQPSKPFRLRVYDEATKRGVPLVEVQALTNQKWFTDSNGLVAIDDPVLMNRTAFFYIKSHGYEFKKDGFGFAGARVELKPGGKIDLPIKRINIAERLYRITGGGIYRHTVALGEKPPIKQPLLNAQVLGSDSVQTVPYKGRLYWFWGDTQRVSYPLGNFNTPGAVSLLPGKGGLDPDVGVDLEYFADKDGFAKGAARMPGDGPTWTTGLLKLRDSAGQERMFAGYTKIRNMLDAYERGLMEWDDSAIEFRKSATFKKVDGVFPVGQTIRTKYKDREFIHFCDPAPLVRLAADVESLTQFDRCEVFGIDANQKTSDWKSGRRRYESKHYGDLVKQKKLKPDEVPLPFRDPDTGKRMTPHAGSTVWNRYRQKWCMVTTEIYGTSLLGELWYAEADSPVGPWVYGRKILTHDDYSFYNPKLHQVFFKENGRIVYFEGTYTTLFTGNKNPTPDYDYNQIMYRMNLDDPRLNLPTPIYEVENSGIRFVTKNGLSPESKGRAPFCALDHPSKETKPVYCGDGRLAIDKPPTNPTDRSALVFFALPRDAKNLPASAVALHERYDESGKRYVYSVRPGAPVEEDPKLGKRIMFVWENPKADEPTLRAEEVMSWKDATPAVE